MVVEVLLVVIFIVLIINVQRIKTNQRIASSEYESLLEAIHTVEGKVNDVIEHTIDKAALKEQGIDYLDSDNE